MPEATYSQALNMALREEMQRDERVFCLGEDIKDSTYGVTRGLYDEFGPKRVVGTPISEAAIGGAALGSAAVGMRPVAEFMYMTFMMCAMDQLVNQAAKMKYMFGGKAVLPIVYRTMAGAGRANAAQHTQDLASWFSHVPGIKVVMPTTAYDAKGLLKTAIRDDNPVVFVENKVLYATAKEDVPDTDYTVPFGKAAVRREGKDVTIVGLQRMVETALEAADAAGGGRDRGGGDRPPHPGPAGRGDDRQLGAQDAPGGGGARGPRAGGLRGGGDRPGGDPRLRLPGRPPGAGGQPQRPHPV